MLHYFCDQSCTVIFFLFILSPSTVFGVESLLQCPYPDISIESRPSMYIKSVCTSSSMVDCYTINNVRVKTFPQHTEVTYACFDNKSYELVGSECRFCQANKTWSGSAPKCRLRETIMYDEKDDSSFRSIQGRSYSPPSPDDNNDDLNKGSSSGSNSNAIVIGIVVLLFIIAIALGIISCIYIRKMRKLDRAMSDNRSGNLFTVCEHPPTTRATTRSTGPRYVTNPNEEWRDNERAYQNIIPLRVNDEPQYIQVETGSGPMVKVPHRQSSENVVYSEIIHQNPRT